MTPKDEARAKPSPENLREAEQLARRINSTECWDAPSGYGDDDESFNEHNCAVIIASVLQAKDDAAKAIREKFKAANEGEGDAYTRGWFEGRDAARAEPVNAPQVSGDVKKPDWLLHYQWLSENTGGDLSQIKEMYAKAVADWQAIAVKHGHAAKLREALEFYADEDNWVQHVPPRGSSSDGRSIMDDTGRTVAQEALAAPTGEKHDKQ